jgi:PmbA protein
MTYEQFKPALFAQAQAHGFSDFELYYTASDSFSVEIFKGEISKYQNTDEVGLCFRGTHNGRVGYAYTEKMDEDIIPSLLKNAAANASVIEEEQIERLYPGDESYPQAKGYNPALGEASATQKIDMAFALEGYALGLDARIEGLDYCHIGTGEHMTRIANSYGLDIAHQSNVAFAWLMARAKQDGVVKTGFDFWVGNDFAQFDYKKLADSAVQIALSALGAKSVPSGDYPILFDHDAARSLFAAYVGVFYAENAQKGFSLLKDKEGTPIAADCVTLRDDACCDASFVCVPFDSEGVATQNKAVIQDGVLKTLLYNTKSAQRDGRKSTGNGFKPGFRGLVGTSFTNFYMQPSDQPREQLMAEMNNGILITDLSGIHAGVNTISGDFSLSADGFLIEGGQLSRPVEQITVAGNFYDMLKNITAVGCDLRFGSPEVGMPSFAVRSLRVSGL